MVHTASLRFEELKHWVTSIKNLITQIVAVRDALNVCANDVKNEIQSVIAKEIKVMHTREGWLLHHVDDIQHFKEESLSLQLQEAEAILPELECLIDMGAAALEQDDRQFLMEQLMKKLSSLSLSPNEDGFLGFEAEPRELDSAIIKLGKVTTKFEDSSVVTDTITSTSSDSKELTLHETSALLDKTALPLSEITCYGPAINDPACWLACHADIEGDSNSLMEDTGAIKEEFGHNEAGSDNSVPNESGGKWLPNCVLNHWKKICKSPHNEWLLQPSFHHGLELRSNALEGPTRSEIAASKLFSYFYQIAKDPKFWLRSGEERSKCKGSFDKASSQVSFQHVESVRDDSRVWLKAAEALVDNKTKHVTQFRELASRPLSEWKKIGQLQDEQIMVQKVVASASLSSKQWLYPTKTEPGTEMYASHDSLNFSDTDSVTKDFSSPVSGDQQPWLSKLSCGNNSFQSPWKKPFYLSRFEEIQNTSQASWLQTKPDDSYVKPDLCIWLARSSQERCTDCPGSCSYDLVKSLNDHSSLNLSKDWLLKGNDW